MNLLSGLEVANLASVQSPSLLVWPARVQANVDRMIEMVGGDPSRLRPHVKTHKMAAVVRMQMDSGITMFKGATIAELEMCLANGARDVLLAYPPVGPNQDRMIQLARKFPEAKLSFVTDDSSIVQAMAALSGPGLEFGVFLDFDCGMHRTGTSSLEAAGEIASQVVEAEHLSFEGIHAYDGHAHAPAVDERETVWSASRDLVRELQEALERIGLPVETVVAGGSPTFGFHAAQGGWQCSPGTTLFWDGGYGSKFPDLPFEPAALVLTRLISKPGTHRLCLDLGHKAIAAENPIERRVQLIGLEDARPLIHSEEHFVVEVDHADRFVVGDTFLGLPWHICPTVALHQEAFLVRDGEATGETWEVTARNRRLAV